MSDRRKVPSNASRLYYKAGTTVAPPSRAMWHDPHTNHDNCLRTRRRDKDQNAIMRSLTRLTRKDDWELPTTSQLPEKSSLDFQTAGHVRIASSHHCSTAVK